MKRHAYLSPSSAERWLTCTRSVGAIQEAGIDTASESPYAAEGAVAHAVAEHEAAERLLGKPGPPIPEGADDEMYDHAQAYVDFLETVGPRRAEVLLEQRVNPKVPECFGTADAVILSPTTLDVVDYKYGRGVAVEAEENPQLMLYGLGALETFDLLTDPTEIELHVFQPRLGNVSSWTISAAELRTWRDEVVMPAAEAALAGTGIFRPSVAACRFCPLSGQCRVRAESVALQDFAQPAMMSPEELGAAMEQVAELRQWLDSLERTALERARVGMIPGWKMVRSGGKRKIDDAPHAIQTLIDHGFKAEQVARLELKTLSELDRLTKPLGGLQAVLGDLVGKTPGRESLAPESDPRPAVGPDFEVAD